MVSNLAKIVRRQGKRQLKKGGKCVFKFILYLKKTFFILFLLLVAVKFFEFIFKKRKKSKSDFVYI